MDTFGDLMRKFVEGTAPTYNILTIKKLHQIQILVPVRMDLFGIPH